MEAAGKGSPLLASVEALFESSESIVIAAFQVRAEHPGEACRSWRASTPPSCCCCCFLLLLLLQAQKLSHSTESTGSQLLKALGAKVRHVTNQQGQRRSVVWQSRVKSSPVVRTRTPVPACHTTKPCPHTHAPVSAGAHAQRAAPSSHCVHGAALTHRQGLSSQHPLCAASGAQPGAPCGQQQQHCWQQLGQA